MHVAIIVAVAENGVIGHEGGMPWHMPEDLKRFKRLTMGSPILMGRKTWESIGRPLPGRENVVITRNAAYRAEGATVVGSLEDALAHAAKTGAATAFVIGGGEIYRQALPRAHRIEITRIHAPFAGDTTFPPLGREWRETAREPHAADGGRPAFDFVTLERGM